MRKRKWPQRRRSVPVVLQQERSECGLACLAMVASTIGCDRSLTRLRRMSGPVNRGAGLEQLLRLSRQLGLVARPVKLPLSDLRKLALPAVLHWRMNHYVVLVRVHRRQVLIHDPAIGRQWVAINELDASFTGIALELRRGPDFVPCARDTEAGLFRLIRGVRDVRQYLATVLLLVLAGQLMSLAPALVTQLLIDEVILGQADLWLQSALIGLAAVLLSGILLDMLRRWLTLYAGARLAVDTTCNLVAHLFRVPAEFIRDRHLGDVMSRLDSLVPLRQAVTEKGVDVAANVTMLFVTLAVMTIFSVTLTLVSLIGLLATFTVLGVMLPKMQQLNNRLLAQRADENTSLMESLRAYESIQSLGLADVRGTHWQNRYFASTDTAYRLGRREITRTSLLGIIAGGEQVAFLLMGISGAIEQKISIGVLFAFMSLRSRFAGAATRLVEGFHFFSLLRVHVRRLADLTSVESEKPAPAGAHKTALVGKLEARKMNFGFSPDTPLVRNFECRIAPGTHVVITGPSGCGKSTLLRIMSGQLAPGSGEFLVDDVELELWDRAAYVQQIGVVLQSDHLFQGTIAENIAGFSACPDMARVRRAAMAASVWDDIRQMPMQTETLLGDTGSSLSGGQVQRLAIARALYREPKILFLDEATSQLDIETENRVLANIGKLDITIVSVAHRPGAIEKAAQVITISESTAKCGPPHPE